MRKSEFLKVVVCLFFTAQVALSQQTVEEWQKKAVADFPELGVRGSAMNVKFVETVNALRVTTPSFFDAPNWPYLVAQQVAGVKPAEQSIIPGLESSPKPAASENPAAKVEATDTNGTIDVRQLATDFKIAQKVALAKYAGKRLTISGEILRIAQPDTPASAAYVFLKTGDGLSPVKVELNKMRKYAPKNVSDYWVSGKNGFEFRVDNDATLQVRTHETRSRNHPYWYDGHNGGSMKNGPWNSIISKGEVIKIIGTCSGLTYGITLTDSELQKDDLP